MQSENLNMLNCFNSDEFSTCRHNTDYFLLNWALQFTLQISLF